MRSLPFISEKYNTEVISLALAKEWLEMDIDGYEGKDDLIQECIDSAVASIESTCNLQLGLSTYTWNTTCLPVTFTDTFYVKEIVSISKDGVVIPDSQYRLMQISKRSSVIVWNNAPSTWQDFQIVFKAGFATVPKDLKQAIRARIGEYYLNRGDGVSEKKTLSDKLIASYIIQYAG